jgi:hypothetical protein
MFLPKKCSLWFQIYGFGIRDPEKTYSGFRIPESKRHRIPDPQHCLVLVGEEGVHPRVLVALVRRQQVIKHQAASAGASSTCSLQDMRIRIRIYLRC